MKKRITALLLCLVMVFSLIPTTVWAAAAVGAPTRANSSVPLTLTVSSYGAPFKNGSTGEHTVSSYKASKYITLRCLPLVVTMQAVLLLLVSRAVTTLVGRW